MEQRRLGTWIDADLDDRLGKLKHGQKKPLVNKALRAALDAGPSPDDPQDDSERDLVKEMLDLHRILAGN